VSGIGNIAGLDAVDAEPFVEVERVAKLRLVVAGSAASLVMPDQSHAAFATVGDDRLEVEVRRRAGEVEVVAVAEPGAVPADVPALDQHAAEAMLRREVDVPLRIRRGRAVLRTGRPGGFLQMQFPPDADVLRRLEPADVAEHVRLVEV
jgi:D-aminopeptidase